MTIMTGRNRNRIIRSVHLAIGLLLLIALACIGYKASPKMGLAFIAIALGQFVIIVTSTYFYIRAMRRATDAILKEIGKTRDDLPHHEEPPLPIIPPLAENKGELF